MSAALALVAHTSGTPKAAACASSLLPLAIRPLISVIWFWLSCFAFALWPFCICPMAFCLALWPAIFCLFPHGCCLLPFPYGLLPLPYSLSPMACHLLPFPCGLLPSAFPRWPSSLPYSLLLDATTTLSGHHPQHVSEMLVDTWQGEYSFVAVMLF